MDGWLCLGTNFPAGSFLPLPLMQLTLDTPNVGIIIPPPVEMPAPLREWAPEFLLHPGAASPSLGGNGIPHFGCPNPELWAVCALAWPYSGFPLQQLLGCLSP